MTASGPDSASLALLAEESPAMLWRGDTTGRCVFLSRAMREFWGLEPEDCGRFDWSSSLLEEDQAAVFEPFSAAMAEQSAFTCEGRYRRADGEVRVLQTRARPYHDAEGRFAGMVGVNEDITELRVADQELSARNQELRDSLARLRSTADRFALATNISGLAMSEHDDALKYVWAHNVPEACLGQTPAEFIGPDVGAPLEAILRRTLDAGETQSEEISFMVGEQRVWCDIQASPSTLPDGRPGVVASALDVTTRKLNETKLEVLARELAHRVKNVFAVVQAIVRQSANATDVPEGFVESIEARLMALAAAQDALMTMSDDRFSLPDLLARQLSHLERVEMEGPEVLLPGRIAPYLSLAVHELGTNALKYGSLSATGGRVEVRWAQTGPDQVRLSWQECGGPTVAPCPTGGKGRGGGFGSQLLTRVFEGATGGEVDLQFASEGLHWTATIPTGVELRL
ncbi:MAG: PAS domain-containing protein [Brevundimonas sp.]|uniref:sensor histidine kinase n=1 Tax=Brevundimonas sp. TaxID=1871086 RepID=UPI00273662A4|nr:PAS domain-containing protein [Brevundimonas sp.]MDP3379457.1 PAS domain-containing protein [Brevundimonas sp.]